jgi:hypothetical protein
MPPALSAANNGLPRANRQAARGGRASKRSGRYQFHRVFRLGRKRNAFESDERDGDRVKLGDVSAAFLGGVNGTTLGFCAEEAQIGDETLQVVGVSVSARGASSAQSGLRGGFGFAARELHVMQYGQQMLIDQLFGTLPFRGLSPR